MTELTTQTPIQRAQSVLGFDAAKAELAELATKSQGITEITNKAGYDECHAARMALKNKRLDIQKTGKAAREDAQAYSKAVISVEKDLVAVIEGEESRLQALQSEWDDARLREREAAERAEAERIQKQQDALATITGALGKLFGADVSALTLALEQLDGFDMEQFDDVFRPAAEQARAEATGAITKARDERIALDEQAAELARQREDQARIEAEAAEQRRQADESAQAERDRQAAEAQAKADAEAAQRRETQEREDRERAERIAEEDRQRAAQAESDRVAREAEESRLAEARQKLEAEQAAQRAAEAKAEQERQEAAQRAEDERLAREQAEAAERAEAEARAAAQASEEAITALIENTAADNGEISGDDGESGWHFTTEQLQAFGRALIKAVQS